MNVLDVIDRLRDEIADVIVMQRINNSVAIAPTRHQAEMTQQPQLVRNRRCLQLHIPRELRHRTGRLSQPRKNPHPARRRERLHRLGDRAGEPEVQLVCAAQASMSHAAQNS